MIDHARVVLDENNLETKESVFMNGFSASGNFLTRFPMIHPERVRTGKDIFPTC